LPEGFSGCSIKGVKKQKQHKLMTSFSQKSKSKSKRIGIFPFSIKKKEEKRQNDVIYG